MLEILFELTGGRGFTLSQALTVMAPHATEEATRYFLAALIRRGYLDYEGRNGYIWLIDEEDL